MRKVKVNYREYISKPCCPQRAEGELEVFGNLAVTPAQMMKMAEKGIPISGQNLSMMPEEGSSNPTWDLPLDQIKGVDPAQLWEESQIIKEKARLAHIRDRHKYGDGELITRESNKKK